MALEYTPQLGLPLPHPDNSPRTVDVPRLRAALTAIDELIKDLQLEDGAIREAIEALDNDKADKDQVALDIAAAISDLLDGAPEAYDTLKEIAAKLADNDDVVSGILSQLGSAVSSIEDLQEGKADLDGDGKVPAAQLPSFATQAQAEAGTDNTRPMTPLRTAQAIAAKRGVADGLASLDANGLVPPEELMVFGVGQTWQQVTRTRNTSYQNTTGKPIILSVHRTSSNETSGVSIQLSEDNDEFRPIAAELFTALSDIDFRACWAIIPNDMYYKVVTRTMSAPSFNCRELR